MQGSQIVVSLNSRLESNKEEEKGAAAAGRSGPSEAESGPLRAVHLSRHKWPGGLIN
jgi:hypothetical protein